MVDLEKIVTGEIDVEEFIKEYHSNNQLVECVDALIPEEAKTNKNHPLWNERERSYSVFKSYSFKLSNCISVWVRHYALGEKLNYHDLLSRFYCFHHPEVTPTNKYEEQFNFLIDIMGDNYGGNEVDGVIEEIVKEFCEMKPKTQARKLGKQKLKETFHTEDGKLPYWIQSAEWPMGQNTPMKFIEKKKHAEYVEYIFEDVDTKEIRVITQYH